MLLAINKKIINRNELNDTKANAEGWENLDPSPKELASLINAGYALSPQFRDGYRKTENFICAGYIGVDIDDGMTVEEALANDFVKKYSSIFYTTARHTPEAHRFRIIFELETPIADPEIMRLALIGVGKKFGGDPKIKDAARMFFGSRGSKPTVFGNILPQDQFDEIILLGKIPRKISENSANDKRGKSATTCSNLTLDLETLILDQYGIPHKPSELTPRTPVFCPFHLDNHPSAFMVKSKKGSVGIHCSTCGTTFWSNTQAEPYNFYQIDEIIKREATKPQNLDVDADTGQVSTYFDFDDEPWHIVTNEKYLPKVPVSEGVTLIKSPKGSGKTQFLESLIKKLKKEKKRILLVGHRQLLLQEISQRLGLTCYLVGNQAINKSTPHYAISVDSLANRDLINPYKNKYDAIIIDESEQVFSHFVSDTLRERRRIAFLALEYYLSNASIVVALDADLNIITVEALSAMIHGKPDIRLVLNEYASEEKTLDLYNNKNHLLSDLFDAITRNERCFVSSNSKTFVDSTTEAIKEKFGDTVRWLKFTQDNSSEEDTIDILKNLKTRILDYQVVLASPTLGTGVDISFEDGIQHVDGVYGFFEGRINTHFDIDQQLSRVRDPKYVKIWITPETFNFETEESVILNELIENEALPEIMEGYKDNGRVNIDDKNPFLNLYACVLAAQRASKNHLKDHFIQLRKRNGWEINPVDKDVDKAGDGGEIAKVGKELILQARTESLMSTRVLSNAEYKERSKLKRTSMYLSRQDKLALERAEIERFYGDELTKDLIIQDDKGKFRKQITRFERLFEQLISENKSNKSGPFVTYSEYAQKRTELRSRLLIAAGVLDQDGSPDFNREVTADTLDLFITTCHKNKAAMERMINLPVRKDIRTKPTSQLRDLLTSIGLGWTRRIKRVGNEKTYQYILNRDQWDKMVEISKRRRIKNLLSQDNDEDDEPKHEPKKLKSKLV